MKRFTFLALFFAMVLGLNAQYYMHVWYNDSLFSLPVVNVDSVTFTDGPWVEPEEPSEPELPTEAYQGIGVFSVGEGKTVTFSPGNLQYTQSTNTWSFASTQSEVIGTDNVIGGSVCFDPEYGYFKSGTVLADKVDLFWWSTSTNNFGVGTSQSNDTPSDLFVDWGTNKIGNDAPNTWRTLTYSEWNYLLDGRPNASSLRGVAQVNGVNGLIFLPDNWTCPAGITFKSGFHSNFGVDYYAAYQTFTAEQWAKMESVGAVFLPTAGLHRDSYVLTVQYGGNYWCATENNNGNACYLCFSPDVAKMHDYNRNNGLSVRLVKDTIANSANQPIDPYNGHEYVDLGLPSGLKWATCNVGANAPEEYGDYFAWGEVESKNYYDWDSYKWCNGSYDALTKYCTDNFYGTVDNKTVLDKEDDPAAVKWGGAWRTPTKAEQDELRQQCTWTKTTLNGVSGYNIVGPNSNSIFLPAAGYASDSYNSQGTSAYYWSSSICLDNPSQVYVLNFSSTHEGRDNRFYGQSVRAVCLVDDTQEPEAPTQCVGVFSVSEDKQVTFSKGNLQYHPANNKWRFAENQTDYLATLNKNISNDYDGWLDAFGWGTGDEPTKSSTSNSDYRSFVDWGTNQIGNDAPNTWRTLSAYEWGYLFENRPNASLLYGIAQVNGVNGMIILPDDWVSPEGINFKSGLYWSFVGDYSWYQSFTSDQWLIMEQAGAIFLPAAGSRNGTNVYDDENYRFYGFYWSKTNYGNESAYFVNFRSGRLVSQSYGGRNLGISVRLVKDVSDTQ